MESNADDWVPTHSTGNQPIAIFQAPVQCSQCRLLSSSAMPYILKPAVEGKRMGVQCNGRMDIGQCWIENNAVWKWNGLQSPIWKAFAFFCFSIRMFVFVFAICCKQNIAESNSDYLTQLWLLLPSYRVVFFNWPPPKKLKYVKPRLGESTLL